MALTIEQAVSEGYGSQARLYCWMRAGKLPYRKVGRRRFIDEADLASMGKIRDDEAYRAIVAETVARAPRLTDEQARKLISILKMGS